MGIRGTFHLAVDTNYIFHRSFFARYKSVEFKYVKGKDGYADCIVAYIQNNIEVTYALMSELVSVFSFARDKAFIIDSFSSCSDQFRGNLADRKPGVERKRMMQVDFASNSLAGDFGIAGYCPKIEAEDQGNLARLYRLARVEEYVNFISSFLFYYHIIDHPCLGYPEKGSESIARKYINDFCSKNHDQYYQAIIEKVNNNRVFDKINNENRIDDQLGTYIKDKVRHSVSHIIRDKKHDAHSLIIDSFEQNAHFYYLKELMRYIARDKLENHHGFNNYCEQDTLYVYPVD